MKGLLSFSGIVMTVGCMGTPGTVHEPSWKMSPAPSRMEEVPAQPRLDLHPEECTISDDGTVLLSVGLENPHPISLGVELRTESLTSRRPMSDSDDSFEQPSEPGPGMITIGGCRAPRLPPAPEHHVIDSQGRFQAATRVEARDVLGRVEVPMRLSWGQFVPSTKEETWSAQACWSVSLDVEGSRCSVSARPEAACNVPGGVLTYLYGMYVEGRHSTRGWSVE